jgi:hypothetical protein
MENLETILKSLIPLILIILFSWLFSVLGSKARKPTENAEGGAEKNLGDRILEMMKEEPEETPREPAARGPVQIESRVAFPQQTGSPVVTAKPINPKWWGA